MKFGTGILKNSSEWYQPSKESRFERKFVVERLGIHQIKSIILHHPAIFKAIYHTRQINNIYLDTIDHKTYFDNVYGNTNRVKVRIRWYGDTFGYIEKPVLELKIKKGLAGRKRSFKLEPFTLDTSFSSKTLRTILSKSDLPDWVREKLSPYLPALLNSYVRKYYVSRDKKVRITLDNLMTYYHLSPRNNSFKRKIVNKNAVIVEMKYSIDAAHVASQISQHLPVRLSKSSKYVNGIEAFNTHYAT